jgi:UDPglucose 6-dehydrogenase
VKDLLGDLSGKVIGLLGLSFKPNTDDMRDAPAITISDALLANGASVRAYDPVAMDAAIPLLPNVEMFSDPYAMAEGCDALIVITEWNEFKQLDLARVRDSMRQPVLFDGRNIYDPVVMKQLGFTYRGFGRGYNGSKLSLNPLGIEAEKITY